MTEQQPDFIKAMPEETKPARMQVKVESNGSKKKRPIGKIIAWVTVVIVAIILVVQYVNAAKYDALVQVIAENKIGVNPTGERLDFGDLPKGKSAVRTVTLKSEGNTGAYVMVWKFGGIADLMKVNKNYFTLRPKSEEKLEFSVYIPDSAEYKYYKGKVIIFQIPKIW